MPNTVDNIPTITIDSKEFRLEDITNNNSPSQQNYPFIYSLLLSAAKNPIVLSTVIISLLGGTGAGLVSRLTTGNIEAVPVIVGATVGGVVGTIFPNVVKCIKDNKVNTDEYSLSQTEQELEAPGENTMLI